MWWEKWTNDMAMAGDLAFRQLLIVCRLRWARTDVAAGAKIQGCRIDPEWHRKNYE